MRFRRHQEAAAAGTRRLLSAFVVLVLALVLAVNIALALVWVLLFPWTDGFPRLFFETNSAVVLLFVLGGCAIESMRLQEGGAHVARLAGGRPADTSQRLERRLHNVVVEMALAANTRPPAAWVLPREHAINAFAAGWNEGDAVIGLTRGALERLDRAELQGVVGHELSHLVHGDTRLNMRLIGLVWGLRMVFDAGHGLVEADDMGRRPATLPFGLALMAVGSLGWLAGRALQAAVSRQREFLADASAVKYTRQVAGLGGALRKIAEQQRLQRDRLHAATGSLGHLFLAQHTRWEGWATHPPLAERIRRLYGRPMAELPAETLPAPKVDEPLAAVPGLVPGLAAQGGAVAMATTEAAATRRDLFQHAMAAGPDDAERLQRIARWASPLELRAALLALMGAGPAAWSAVPQALALTMIEQLQDLSPGAAAVAFDALAQRAADEPRAWRTALLHDAAAATTTPAALQRWLLLRHRLRRRTATLRPTDRRRQLARAAEAVALVTRGLSMCLGLDEAPARAWSLQVLTGLRWGQALLPAARPREVCIALLRLQRLPALQKPRLLRAWLDAGLAGQEGAATQAAIALGHACTLLDLAPPPELMAGRPLWPAD